MYTSWQQHMKIWLQYCPYSQSYYISKRQKCVKVKKENLKFWHIKLTFFINYLNLYRFCFSYSLQNILSSQWINHFNLNHLYVRKIHQNCIFIILIPKQAGQRTRNLPLGPRSQMGYKSWAQVTEVDSLLTCSFLTYGF